MTGPFSSFFGLRDNPFRANPDPRYLVLTRRTQDSLDELIEGIRGRKGLLLLTGEVGTGKTLLLNHLMEWLDRERIPKAFIFNSHLKVNEVFDLILTDFGIPFVAQRGTPLAHFTSWLQDRFRAGQTAVLIVDEAQGLALNVIEELCMLLNLQTPEGNLLQIILCGQPEFEEMLQRPGLRQMRQRVAVRCRTLPLTLEETRAYIGNRLRVAGASDSEALIFHPEGVQALFLYSGGIPRVLNLLCEQAIMRASREQLRPVPGRIVGEAAHQFQLDGARPVSLRLAADAASVSDLFTAGPVLRETPGRFAVTPLPRDGSQLAPNSLNILSSRQSQPAAPAASGESVARRDGHAPGNSPTGDVTSETPRSPHPPIRFPLQVRPTPPTELGLKEIVARRSLVSPTVAPPDALIAELAAASDVAAHDAKPQARTPRREPGLAERWKRDFPSMAKRAKSGIAGMYSQARIFQARAEMRVRLSFETTARRWAALRGRDWHVRTRFAWPDFATSCFHWLRATATRPTLPRVSMPARHQGVPHPAPTARGTLALPAKLRRLRNSALHTPRSGNLENTRRLTTSVLHWLQQPTRGTRNHPAARSSSTRIA
jgi:general secretion pathway protein A